MLTLVVLGLLGACVGSFLNVVIHRLPKPGLSVTSPKRSFCPRCQAQIGWYDNIPIVSYFVLLGRCRSCRTPIPLRYLVVELLTASLFILFAAVHPPLRGGVIDPQALLRLLIECAVVAAAVAVTYIDWDEKIIPDEITLPGCVLLPFVCLLVPVLQERGFGVTRSLRAHLPAPFAAYFTSTIGELVGMGVLYALVVVFSRLIPLYWRGLRSTRRALGRVTSADPIPSRVEAMGLGDVKYLALIGAVLGPEGALVCFGVACVVGAFLGLVVRAITGDREVPFGPFLSVGLLVMMLAGDQVVGSVLVALAVSRAAIIFLEQRHVQR